ncbi:hypothetical protein [Burkholderia sp. Ac-20365]|uniref:hypothetical protein n=1 Tax=Burkholderia sp. Ac-20365 TaxID=2703897 RepID=UPI00197B0DFC|nr:hypothetical protein [Burkholderia sp. Ac-20365]MBN3761187.1 hypothetical protein [Burkholderia sp. Ac-20365]
MNRNYLVTGAIGSGKSTIARALAATLGESIAVFDHQTQDIPRRVSAAVVILDEAHVDLLLVRLSGLELSMSEGTRLVFVSRDVASVPAEILGLMEREGGFHHIQTGLVNRLAAEVEIVPISSSAAMWERLLDAMGEQKRERAVDRVLSEFSAAVSDANISPMERASLNARIGLLASAVRRPVQTS